VEKDAHVESVVYDMYYPTQPYLQRMYSLQHLCGVVRYRKRRSITSIYTGVLDAVHLTNPSQPWDLPIAT
jgi:hypothetical protein